MFSQTTALLVTCARCGAARALPEADRARWPAVTGQSITVQADRPCACGSRRIRLTVNLK